MDDIDRAQDREQLGREFALAEAQRKLPEMLLPVGICYNCQEHIDAGLKFCDEYCRDDFDERKAAERRRGVDCRG